MRGGLVLGDVVGVVGRQRRNAQVLGDAQQFLADRGLDRDAVVHQLKEVVLLAEDVLVLARDLERLVVLAEPQPGLHRARRAAGGRDDPLVVLLEQFVVHPRPLAVVAVERRQRRDLHQVPQPLGGGRQQRLVQVGAGRGHVAAAPGGLVGLALVLVAPVDRLLVQPGLGRDVRLDPDDGRQPGARRRSSGTRRRRTCCRGRSSPPRACPGPWPARPAWRSSRHRRASSTRCGHAGARTNRWSRHPPRNPAGGQSNPSPGDRHPGLSRGAPRGLSGGYGSAADRAAHPAKRSTRVPRT